MNQNFVSHFIYHYIQWTPRLKEKALCLLYFTLLFELMSSFYFIIFCSIEKYEFLNYRWSQINCHHLMQIVDPMNLLNFIILLDLFYFKLFMKEFLIFWDSIQKVLGFMFLICQLNSLDSYEIHAIDIFSQLWARNLLRTYFKNVLNE